MNILQIKLFPSVIQSPSEMGNKIGFEADNESVKLAYVEQDVQHIKFIQSLNSKYLCSQIKWSNAIIFLFKCSIQEFLSYHTSQNVGLLRSEYQKLLSAQELVIRTNRATMNILNENKQLSNALKDILMKKFTLEHTQRIDNSVSSMHILQTNFQQFYKFKHTFNITQLHNFHTTFLAQKHIIKHLPQKFVLVILRNGITAYKIERGKKTERIDGSVIGQKTIISLLKFKYPNKTINQCFDEAFSNGNLQKVDLMVEDIYGKNCHNLGLPGEIVASSLGKLAKMDKQQLKMLKQSDIIRSIITTFAINTSNLTALYLSKTNFNDAVILADTFHNDKFYSLLESISDSYAPGKTIIFSNHAPFMACLGTAFTNYLSVNKS